MPLGLYYPGERYNKDSIEVVEVIERFLLARKNGKKYMVVTDSCWAGGVMYQNASDEKRLENILELMTTSPDLKAYEVYDTELSMVAQISEERAWHVPGKSMKEINELIAYIVKGIFPLEHELCKKIVESEGPYTAAAILGGFVLCQSALPPSHRIKCRNIKERLAALKNLSVLLRQFYEGESVVHDGRSGRTVVETDMGGRIVDPDD